MSARPDCAICGHRAWMSFTDRNVPLCDAHYTEWLREPTCKFDAIFKAMGWEGDLTTSTVARVKAFQFELAKRTEAWATAQREARAA